MAKFDALDPLFDVLAASVRLLASEAEKPKSGVTLTGAINARRQLEMVVEQAKSAHAIDDDVGRLALERGIGMLLRDRDFATTAGKIPFRSKRLKSHAELLKRLPREIVGLLGVRPSVLQALAASHTLLDRKEHIKRTAEPLRSLIPAQKIAPIQFAVDEGRLVLADGPESRSDAADKPNIEDARGALIESGEGILKELYRSNCDRRLLESVQHLQEKLSNRQNIIAVGLSSLACSMMCDAYKAELPLGMSAMIGAHCRSVELYAAQFPDWSRFVANAASAQLETKDVEVVHEATTKLIKDLRGKAELVDPKVPETLARLNELLRDPATASRRAAFAVLRSIENLASKTLEYCSDFVDKTARGVVDRGSSVASKVIVLGFLGLAVTGAVSITPVASKIHEMQWLSKAIELIQREMRLLE